MNITKMISKYNHHTNNNIQYIVIHDVGTPSTAKNNGVYFQSDNRNASAHYFIDDTDCVQVVEDFNCAWHCGDGGNRYGINNSNSIGIEMCLPTGILTEKTINRTVELTKELMKKYNVPMDRVVRHYDASRKNCPQQFNLKGNWARWYDFKKRLESNSNTRKKGVFKMFIYFNDKDMYGVWGNSRFHLNNADKVKHFKAIVKDSTGMECKEYRWFKGSEQIKTVESFTTLSNTIK